MAAAAARARQPPPAPRGIGAGVLLAALASALTLTAVVNRCVPEPYMDEPFHVGQTARYCTGRWREWDPKITTLPGLYALGVAYAAAARATLGWAGVDAAAACGVAHLRSLNALLWVACLQLAFLCSLELQQQQQQQRGGDREGGGGSSGSKADQQQQQQQRRSAALVAALLSLLPTHAFFAPLYYTDVAALAALLLTLLLLLRGATRAAALAGAAAVLVRQTNAVWVAFLTGAALLRELQQQQQQQQQQQAGPTRGQKKQQQQQSLAAELLGLLSAAAAHWRTLLPRFAPLLAVLAAFAAFCVANGGVAVGDRAAHAPALHLAQALYFAPFAAAAAAPAVVPPALDALGHAARERRLAPLLALALAGAAAAAAIASRFTVAHPYLLADNRHYTFYLWRRVLGRPGVARYALAPAAAAAWLALGAALGAASGRGRVWLLGFVASVVAALAPAGLLELRYFTAPTALALLHAPPPSTALSAATLVAFGAINAATLYVFTQRPFEWPDGSVARFMW